MQPFERDAIAIAQRAARDPDRIRATVLGRQSKRTPEEAAELARLLEVLAERKAARRRGTIAPDPVPDPLPEAPDVPAPVPERRRKR